MRTDKPEAELYVYKDGKVVAELKWQAHRMLADTIHGKIDEVLKESGNSIEEINRIVIFEGPGSFTGLRIGFSVANATGYSQNIPVIASGGEDWITAGLETKKTDFKSTHPVYGREPHITKQKK